MDAGPMDQVAAVHRPEPGFRRKFIHLALGTAIILFFLGDRDLRWPLYLVLLLGTALSAVQERWPLRPLKWLLDRYDKHRDSVPGQGPITFFLGALAAWSFFPEKAAFGAMVVLTFGDPLAFLGGKLIGGRSLPWNPGKTWAGTLLFMVVPVCILVPVLGPVLGIAMPVAGAAFESIPFPDKLVLDDNVLVPIAAGAVGSLMMLVMGML